MQLQPKKVNKIQPHYFEDENLVFSKGNNVYKGLFNRLEDAKKIGHYNAGVLKNIGASFDLTKRLGRLGFHKLKPIAGGIIGIQHGAIVFKPKGGREFKKVCTGFRGSRPLDLFIHPVSKATYFGEYFGNNDRDEVHIYKSVDMQNWDLAWTFQAGEIRHVHGLCWDPYRNGVWVLTGDSDKESGLYFTNDEFQSLQKVVGGSQKARAVEIIPTPEGLIIPMDSPLEQNYIHFYDVQKKEFQKLAELPGSAFHAVKSNGIYLVSTVTEPSEVNKVSYAAVWASLDGKSWKELYRFPKDVVPVKYQFLFRYAEVFLLSGNTDDTTILGYAHGVKTYSNSLVYWEKNDIIHFLSNH